VRAFVLGLVRIVFGVVSSTVAQTVPPNIIVILADDLGYGDMDFNGCQDIPTPNIDSLAANGVRCSNAYATHPFCSPSRAGLLTGRYQQRFGFENNPDDDLNNPPLSIPSDELLISELLKPNGYVCGAIGKWHVGYATNLHPIARGFDSFYGFLAAQSDYFNAQLLRDETRVVETEYLTDGFSREAESFINTHATQPFLLYRAYNAPHVPHEVTQNYLDRVAYITDVNRRILAAMIVAIDDGVGRVLQALQAQNLLEKTLIIFVSDNGAPNQDVMSNYPLRGYKLDTLEGGIRVPFAVQWTGRLPANVVYDGLVSTLDIVPTAAAAAGVSLPADRVYDGLNIVPFLAGEQIAPERLLCWRWFGLGQHGPPGSQDTINAVRKGSLKLVTERVLTA
jgi:arylsulfatase A-like enzyme